MNSKDSENKINISFNAPTYEEWLEAAKHELEGANPIEKLKIRKGTLEILPYYTASQVEGSVYPALKPSLNPYLGARGWLNTPKILVSDEKKANEIALSYLNSGAEGIVFDCLSENINPGTLLNKIRLADCSISFLMNDGSHKWLQDFRLFAETNFDKNEIRGCLFWPTADDVHMDSVLSFATWPQFYSLGIMIEPQHDAVDEIAQSLNKIVFLVNANTKNKITHNVLDQVSFSVSVGTDFFLEIAKLKSIRNLWNQIRGAYGLKHGRRLHIHANSPCWIKDSYQPHGNLIQSTNAAMAAIAGGCDSLTVEPEDYANETMNRIARNVSSILKEESHFSKVADPTAGSYYIDTLIHQLSEKAWSKFQSQATS